MVLKSFEIVKLIWIVIRILGLVLVKLAHMNIGNYLHLEDKYSQHKDKYHCLKDNYPQHEDIYPRVENTFCVL